MASCFFSSRFTCRTACGRRWRARSGSSRGGSDVLLLELDEVSKSFRGLRAVARASFAVERHTITALIGPNGAGKTTLFNLIAGLFRPDEGAIRFNGRAIGGLPPHRVCAAGVGRTFQLVKPFAGLSVLDNAIVGALRGERTIASARVRALAVLARLGLGGKASLLASHLTLADRRPPEGGPAPPPR